MVFELQGSVGEIKEAIATLTRTVQSGFSRIDGVERSTGDIKEALRQLLPKLENLSGFATHRAPSLVDKADIANLKAELKAEIEKRPTRRQTIADIALIVGVIAAAVTLGSRVVH